MAELARDLVVLAFQGKAGGSMTEGHRLFIDFPSLRGMAVAATEFQVIPVGGLCYQA
jgi:hypothetical protein